MAVVGGRVFGGGVVWRVGRFPVCAKEQVLAVPIAYLTLIQCRYMYTSTFQDWSPNDAG